MKMALESPPNIPFTDGKVFAKRLTGFDPTKSGGFALEGDWAETILLKREDGGQTAILRPVEREISVYYIGGRFNPSILMPSEGTAVGALWFCRQRLMGSPDTTLIGKHNGDLARGSGKSWFLEWVTPGVQLLGLPSFPPPPEPFTMTKIERSAPYALGYLASALGLIPIVEVAAQRIEEAQKKMAERAQALIDPAIATMNEMHPLPKGYSWCDLINGVWVIKMPSGERRFIDALMPFITELSDALLSTLKEDSERLHNMVALMGEMAALKESLAQINTDQKKKREKDDEPSPPSPWTTGKIVINWNKQRLDTSHWQVQNYQWNPRHPGGLDVNIEIDRDAYIRAMAGVFQVPAEEIDYSDRSALLASDIGRIKDTPVLTEAEYLAMKNKLASMYAERIDHELAIEARRRWSGDPGHRSLDNIIADLEAERVKIVEQLRVQKGGDHGSTIPHPEPPSHAASNSEILPADDADRRTAPIFEPRRKRRNRRHAK